MQHSTLALQIFPKPVQNRLNLQVNAFKGTVNAQLKHLAGRPCKMCKCSQKALHLHIVKCKPVGKGQLPRNCQ